MTENEARINEEKLENYVLPEVVIDDSTREYYKGYYGIDFDSLSVSDQIDLAKHMQYGASAVIMDKIARAKLGIENNANVIFVADEEK